MAATSFRDDGGNVGGSSKLRFIKYLMFGLLGVSVLESVAYFTVLDSRARVVLACCFLLYGIWALNPFRSKWNREVIAQDDGQGWRFATTVILRTTYLLVLRFAFLLLALAYLAQALAWHDSTMTIGQEKNSFASHLLAIFDWVFPPLTALFQYVMPDKVPTIWNRGNDLVLILRVTTYSVYAFVICAVLRGVWELGYASGFRELSRRWERGNLRGR